GVANGGTNRDQSGADQTKDIGGSAAEDRRHFTGGRCRDRKHRFVAAIGASHRGENGGGAGGGAGAIFANANAGGGGDGGDQGKGGSRGDQSAGRGAETQSGVFAFADCGAVERAVAARRAWRGGRDGGGIVAAVGRGRKRGGGDERGKEWPAMNPRTRALIQVAILLV